MDTLTHGVVGLAVGLAASSIHPQETSAIVVTAVAASELPDIDVLGGRGILYYMQHHRSSSHALVLAPLLAAICAKVCTVVFHSTFFRLYEIALTAILLHLCMDLLNSYGTKIFWPFSKKRIALDILPLSDPWLLGILIAGIIGNRIFYDAFIFAAFMAVGLYVCFRILCYERASHILGKKYALPQSQVKPLPITGRNFCWDFIAMRQGKYYIGQVKIISARVELQNILNQPRLQVKYNQAIGTFLEFARFPYQEYRKESGREGIFWIDLRYKLGMIKKEDFGIWHDEKEEGDH